MSWLNEKERLETLAKTYDKSIKLHTKDPWICKLIAWFLFVVTFGKFKRDKFLKNWAMALANHIFIPREWSVDDAERIIPHEARHTWQFRVLGFYIHPIVGIPLQSIFYPFLLLPIFGAFCRFFMELDANKAYWREKIKKEYIQESEFLRKAKVCAEKLSSYKYLYSIPKPLAEKLCKKTALKVYNEQQAKLG